MEVTLDGEPLTDGEIAALLAGTDGLALLRGQWVEVDRARLEQHDAQFPAAEALAASEGADVSPRRCGCSPAPRVAGRRERRRPTPTGRSVTAGPWLAETLQALRAPDGDGVDPGAALQGTLRPYQQAGAHGCSCSPASGSGACLADDMGLGKTIQVLALLLLRSSAARRRRRRASLSRPLRCWPIGPPRSKNSRRTSKPRSCIPRR